MRVATDEAIATRTLYEQAVFPPLPSLTKTWL
jgi:hypothetical protein